MLTAFVVGCPLNIPLPDNLTICQLASSDFNCFVEGISVNKILFGQTQYFERCHCSADALATSLFKSEMISKEFHDKVLQADACELVIQFDIQSRKIIP